MRCGVVLATALAGCADPVAPPVPESLDVVWGVPAISTPGARFDTVLIRLTTADGGPVPDWPVIWAGDGTVEPLDSLTDELGFARASWTLPRTATYFERYGTSPSGHYALHAQARGFGGVVFSTDAHAFMADAVQSSTSYGCALRRAELWCWGDNTLGGWSAEVPVQVASPPGAEITVLAPGEAHLCVLNATGSAWCRRSVTDSAWQPVVGAPPLLDLTTIESGFSGGTNCGRAASDQRIWCWRQAGSTARVASELTDRAFASIDGGDDFACAVDLGGAGWCWGSNYRGELGDGGTTDSDTPVPVAGGHRFESITAGFNLACGSDLEHQVWCWGLTGQSTNPTAPIRIDLPWAVGPEIGAGGWGEVYVLHDGRIHSWYRGRELAAVADGLARYPVTQMSANGPWCLRTESSEIYCSLAVLHAYSDGFFAFQPIPVPDPASR